MPLPHEVRLLECTWPLHPRLRGLVGHYLKEWGADIICLQETLLTCTDHCIWSNLGWGGESSQVCIGAAGCSGRVMLARKEALFDRITVWRGRFVVAARLLRWEDGLHFVFASAYEPTVPAV